MEVRVPGDDGGEWEGVSMSSGVNLLILVTVYKWHVTYILSFFSLPHLPYFLIGVKKKITSRCTLSISVSYH